MYVKVIISAVYILFFRELFNGPQFTKKMDDNHQSNNIIEIKN